MSENLISTLIYAGMVLAALIVFGLVITRLYKRATKEIAFIRTGLGGEKVVMNGGALVLPVLHETMPVNMNTVRLAVERNNVDALITLDRLRIDVKAEFYVRVAPDAQSLAMAAQTLGLRTMQPELLKDLVEGKFVDALRSVAAGMTMNELHEQRADFVQKVQQASSSDLAMNGLELESVSLTGLDQTSIEHFNANNAFDAEGLTKLTEQIELRKKARNDIEQDTRVQIETKNLEADKRSFEISRDNEFARLEQEREVEMRRATQASEVAREKALRDQEAQDAQIKSKQAVDSAQIEADRAVQQARITQEQSLEIARQEQQIAVQNKSREESQARAEADEARAKAVAAEEQTHRTDRGIERSRSARHRRQGRSRGREGSRRQPRRRHARCRRGRGRVRKAARRSSADSFRSRGSRPARDQRGGQPVVIGPDIAANQAGVAQGVAGNRARICQAAGGHRLDQDRSGRRYYPEWREWRQRRVGKQR
jgi:uncharacterized membrane protein YqiK